MENKEKDVKELNVDEAEQANGGIFGTVLVDQVIGLDGLKKAVDDVIETAKTIDKIRHPIA